MKSYHFPLLLMLLCLESRFILPMGLSNPFGKLKENLRANDLKASRDLEKLSTRVSAGFKTDILGNLG